MYCSIVGNLIEESVATYASLTQQEKPHIISEIDSHVRSTSAAYWDITPDIPYNNPLCRLAYLFMYVPINATIFEKVIADSAELQQTLVQASGGVFRVCAMGGGPGTELLGIAKYLLTASSLKPPSRLSFAVVDRFLQWSDTWQHMADAVQAEFGSSPSITGSDVPMIDRAFLPMNIFDPSSYQDMTYQFQNADLMVFNYLFSENKPLLTTTSAAQAMQRLASIAQPNCLFVVIDRNERSVVDGAVNLFQEALAVGVDVQTISDQFDPDEQQADMGELAQAFSKSPRKTFYSYNGNPTVFWFAVKRS